MKLTTMTQVTIDGVMQGNGAASDDRRNGFERGGWARGKGDDETRTFITQTYQRAEAFLFGRRTYELFAGIISDAQSREKIEPTENYACRANDDQRVPDPAFTLRAWRGVVTYLLRQHSFLYE